MCKKLAQNGDIYFTVDADYAHMRIMRMRIMLIAKKVAHGHPYCQLT